MRDQITYIYSNKHQHQPLDQFQNQHPTNSTHLKLANTYKTSPQKNQHLNPSQSTIFRRSTWCVQELIQLSHVRAIGRNGPPLHGSPLQVGQARRAGGLQGVLVAHDWRIITVRWLVSPSHFRSGPKKTTRSLGDLYTNHGQILALTK